MSETLHDTGTRGYYRQIPPLSFSETRYARYSPSQRDLGDDFKALLRRWRYETLTSSSANEIVGNDAFREIVKMGQSAVDLIIRELREQPDFLVAALGLITGEDPVRDEDRGDVEAMTRAWLDWYEYSR